MGILCKSCGDVMLASFVHVFWGRRPASLVQRQAWLKGMGYRVSKLGSECWNSAGSCTWLCIYDEGWGREMAPASFFIPREVPQRTLRLVTNFSSHKLQAPFKLLLPSCISVGCLLCYLFKVMRTASYCPLGSLRAGLLIFFCF